MRRFSIQARLAACLAVLASILLVVVGLGLAGLHAATNGTSKVGQTLTLANDAMQAKFRTADFAGWQTGYAFDSLREVPGASTDTGFQRKAFLDSTAAFRLDVAAVSKGALTSEERASLDSAKVAFEKFLEVDARIIAGYRKGTRESVLASNTLASGESLELFAVVADKVSALATSVSARGEQSRAAAALRARQTQDLILAALLGGLVLTVATSALVVRSVVAPLSELRIRMREIAEGDGDLTQRVDERGSDELTAVARSFNTFASSVAATIRSVTEQTSALYTASQKLTASSRVIGDNAHEASAQASSVARATEQISDHVSSVSTGTQQMTASIAEIAEIASKAAEVAVSAVSQAEQTNAIVERLGSSSGEIGEVVNFIAGIAGQTKLLALNAAIEAAHAGEAGNGFAVVANEVKELSQATALATESISRRIHGIQLDTEAAIEAITRVAGIIRDISGHQTTIAAAVEEQSATTALVSRNVAEAAKGTQLVSDNIRRVSEVNESTAAGVVQSQAATEELSRMGGELERVVARFTV